MPGAVGRGVGGCQKPLSSLPLRECLEVGGVNFCCSLNQLSTRRLWRRLPSRRDASLSLSLECLGGRVVVAVTAGEDFDDEDFVTSMLKPVTRQTRTRLL